MYDAGPDNDAVLDLEATRRFLGTVDWDRVNSCGFYGGEPSVDLPVYQRFVDLIPAETPRFVITNGSWSTGPIGQIMEFLKFCADNHMGIVVSGTPEHREHQDRNVLEALAAESEGIRLKGDDRIHAMGRAARESWTCGFRCQGYTIPTRLAVMPGGDIIFQNCDGVYPVVQRYEQTFVGIGPRIVDAHRRCSQAREKALKDGSKGYIQSLKKGL